jgi:hypothetical protein
MTSVASDEILTARDWPPRGRGPTEKGHYVDYLLEWAQWPIPDDPWAELTALPATTDDPRVAR